MAREADGFKMSGKYSFAIDRGGTFTDILCIGPENEIKTMKLLSEDPQNYKDAPTEGIRRILQNVSLNLEEVLQFSKNYSIEF